MLYDILSNRLAVNILKRLSENEKKKDYSTNINEIVGNRQSIETALSLLASEGLVYREEQVVSISEKGKRFIDSFDALVAVYRNEPAEKRGSIEIKYELTDFEKKILFLLFKLFSESDEDISLSSLTQELFPYENVDKRKLRVSRAISRLEQLNLARKIKKERNVFSRITETGIKVVKRQIATEVKKVL